MRFHKFGISNFVLELRQFYLESWGAFKKEKMKYELVNLAFKASLKSEPQIVTTHFLTDNFDGCISQLNLL